MHESPRSPGLRIDYGRVALYAGLAVAAVAGVFVIVTLVMVHAFVTGMGNQLARK